MNKQERAVKYASNNIIVDWLLEKISKFAALAEGFMFQVSTLATPVRIRHAASRNHSSVVEQSAFNRLVVGPNPTGCILAGLYVQLMLTTRLQGLLPHMRRVVKPRSTGGRTRSVICIGESFNGRKLDSKSDNGGSIPSSPVVQKVAATVELRMDPSFCTFCRCGWN